MNTVPPKRPVVISDPDGLLSVIPMVLGFHPSDSVVLACVDGPKRLLQPVMQISLDRYRADPERTAQYLAERARAYTDRVLVIFYGLAEDPYDLENRLRAAGLTVLTPVFTGNDPHELHRRLQAEEVGVGKVVEHHREGLRTRVEFDSGDPEPPDVGLLIDMSDPLHFRRDRYVHLNMGRAGEVLLDVLATCRRVPDPPPDASIYEVDMVANLCTVAAMFAYRSGNGALANVCLDRAMRVQPHHRMAHLMVAAIDAALPPARLDALAAEL